MSAWICYLCLFHFINNDLIFTLIWAPTYQTCKCTNIAWREEKGDSVFRYSNLKIGPSEKSAAIASQSGYGTRYKTFMFLQWLHNLGMGQDIKRLCLVKILLCVKTFSPGGLQLRWKLDFSTEFVLWQKQSPEVIL